MNDITIWMTENYIPAIAFFIAGCTVGMVITLVMDWCAGRRKKP